MNFLKTAVAAATLAGALALAGAASADVYTLTQSTAFGTGNFGTVNVTGSSTDLHFVVNLASGYQLVDTGSHFLFSGNLGGTINSVTTTAGLPAGVSLSTGSLSNSPFGGFDFALNCTSCGPGGSSPYGTGITFDILGTGLTVLGANTFNGQPINFAADIVNQAGGTGVVGGGPGGVPEPETWVLMITGIGLAGAVLRRRRDSLAHA